jgi:small subunit ribosomal protein S17e
MGRIRTRWIKNVANELIKKYPDKFNTDFENNKKILAELNLIEDKIIRNKVCGYIVTVISKQAQ